MYVRVLYWGECEWPSFKPWCTHGPHQVLSVGSYHSLNTIFMGALMSVKLWSSNMHELVMTILYEQNCDACMFMKSWYPLSTQMQNGDVRMFTESQCSKSIKLRSPHNGRHHDIQTCANCQCAHMHKIAMCAYSWNDNVCSAQNCDLHTWAKSKFL